MENKNKEKRKKLTPFMYFLELGIHPRDWCRKNWEEIWRKKEQEMIENRIN